MKRNMLPPSTSQSSAKASLCAAYRHYLLLRAHHYNHKSIRRNKTCYQAEMSPHGCLDPCRLWRCIRKACGGVESIYDRSLQARFAVSAIRNFTCGLLFRSQLALRNLPRKRAFSETSFLAGSAAQCFLQRPSW
jgi:hypothetical protein